MKTIRLTDKDYNALLYHLGRLTGLQNEPREYFSLNELIDWILIEGKSNTPLYFHEADSFQIRKEKELNEEL